jgi:hypothetical protein
MDDYGIEIPKFGVYEFGYTPRNGMVSNGPQMVGEWDGLLLGCHSTWESFMSP